MSKFLFVKEAPTTLEKGEYVIDVPNFLPEIQANKAKSPKNGLTGPFQLRMITGSIAQNYDPERMTEYSTKVHQFEGRPYSNDQELNTIVVEMLTANYPAVFSKYIEKKIRTRPVGTHMIYYVDNGLVKNAYNIFIENGLADKKYERESTPAPAKEKKVVGKPALTKEQAEQLKSQQQD